MKAIAKACPKIRNPHLLLKDGMTEIKSEITLKFNELPEATPAPNKKVELLLTDQNGVVFTALINAKSWRKAEADATAFRVLLQKIGNWYDDWTDNPLREPLCLLLTRSNGDTFYLKLSC